MRWVDSQEGNSGSYRYTVQWTGDDGNVVQDEDVPENALEPDVSATNNTSIAATAAKKEDATTTAAGAAFGAPPSTAPGFRQLNVHPPTAPFGGGAAPTALAFGTNTNIAPAFGTSAAPATSAW